MLVNNLRLASQTPFTSFSVYDHKLIGYLNVVMPKLDSTNYRNLNGWMSDRIQAGENQLHLGHCDTWRAATMRDGIEHLIHLKLCHGKFDLGYN